MKKLLFMIKYSYAVIAILSVVSCNKNNDNEVKNYKIIDGCYMGKFDYKGENYWCGICFDSNTYEEFPSGGVIHYQKEMGCLTMGRDSINNSTLSFKLGSFKFPDWYEPCDPVMVLPGNYQIIDIINTDSIIFSRGSGSTKITYYLKKQSS